ncbi:choice-of-anchor Q domain-containing protein [Dokdonella soli]|uniref:Right handed beta helix domain-containing protein n=1 Tax=Dokdonella soli TaxID=529810 RepID=A0ABN1IXI9_9GAMM
MIRDSDSACPFRLTIRESHDYPLAPLAAALALCFTVTTHAASITVNDPSSGRITGHCTLLDAVTSVNTQAVAPGSSCVAGDGVNDTINFSSGFTITFTAATSGVDALVLTKPVTIDGGVLAGGAPRVIIERNGTQSVRLIDATANLTLNGVTLRNGLASFGDGGGIIATGANVTMTNSIVSGNTASNHGGGVSVYHGALMLTNSTVSGNTATTFNGGGIHVEGGSVTSINSTISGNTAGQKAGGIYTNATATLTNTTVSGNTAAGSGGGLFAHDIVLNFSTFSGNSVPSGHVGGGIAVASGATPTATATATLMFGNGPGSDVDSTAPVTLNGDHNLIGTIGTNITLANPTLACDPLLKPLTNNGGPTATQAIYPPSCALDAGPTTTTLATDQRGLPRLFGSATDIGAFEYQGPNDPSDRIFYNGFDP